MMLTAYGLASAAFSQTPALVADGGLYQRAAITTRDGPSHEVRRPLTHRAPRTR
jgi:hypothetical protein